MQRLSMSMDLMGKGKKITSALDEVAIWVNNIVAGGSSVSAGTQTAARAFVTAAKANGYWNKLIIVAPCAGNTVAAAPYYLKYPAGPNAATPVGVSMGYVETGASGGLSGNGVDTYWDTNYNPSTAGASLSSFGLWAWAHTASAGGTSRAFLGSAGAAVNYAILGWVTGGTVESGGIGSATVAEFAVGQASAATGFLGINASGSRSCQWYDGGVAIGAPTVNAGSFVNSNLFFNAINVAGAYQLVGHRRTSFWAISQGLSAGEITSFAADVLAFQTALTRN